MNTTKRANALIAGISLIIMALAAGFSYGYVQNSLVMEGDPGATHQNFINNVSLFGGGIMGWIVILISDILVAWCLYTFFAPTDKKIALATGLARGLYSAALALGIYDLTAAWHKLYSADQDTGAFIQLLDNFEKHWLHGLIVFGFHLIGLGYLSFRSKSVPLWIARLLCLAGVSYTFINGAKVVAPGAADWVSLAEMILSVPMAVAELALAVWLIWKGGKRKSAEIKFSAH